MRIRLRKVRSRSSGYGHTIRGWRGQPLLRVLLRTKKGRRCHDVHLGQVAFGLRGTLEDHTLRRLLFLCRSRLTALGLEELQRSELLEKLQMALRKRRWLVDIDR